MIKYALLLVALSPVVFLIGLVWPKIILPWMKEPNRLFASSVGLLMFMASFTWYSDLELKQKKADASPTQQSQQKGHDEANQLQLNNR